MSFTGPSLAPQRRCQNIVLDSILGFLRGAGEDIGGEAAIKSMLREDYHYFCGVPTPTLPLGLRGGVPASAGAVNLA